MNSHPKRPRDPNQLAGPDQPRGRPHVDIGTKIEIPNNKLKWDKSNPTGHGIVFLSRNGYVFCYVQPGGV
jgi:hypothetical protein